MENYSDAKAEGTVTREDLRLLEAKLAGKMWEVALWQVIMLAMLLLMLELFV